MMKLLFPFLLVLLLPLVVSGQNKPDEKETALSDSVTIYKKIKKFSIKRKWTSWLYGAIFIDPGKSKAKKGEKSPGKRKDNFNNYKKRIIREITIITLDPFGANISDTTLVVENKLVNIGNTLHKKSRKLTIQNQLLFREDHKLDPYKLRESERILRSSEYVRDAKITVNPAEKDSVDIVVLVQDQWSILGAVNGRKVEVFDVNFLGLAHRISGSVNYGGVEKFTYNASYHVPYIRNTFITAGAFYNTSLINGLKGVSVGREFYSPLTKWAGGIDLIQRRAIDLIPVNDTLNAEVPVKYNYQDFWGGVSFKIRAGEEDRERGARLVTTGRILNTIYRNNFLEFEDSSKIYQNSTLYLASIGYSVRRYYKDRYIYKFGRFEDVPEGSLIALVGGYEKREIYGRHYMGIRGAVGRHVENLGYLSGALEYGSFINTGNLEKGVFNGNFSYFSDLWSLKRWAMRQFIYYSYTKGYNRDPNEWIEINGSNGLYGFDGNNARGKNRMMLSFENVLYTPFQLLGFHFATLAFAGFGLVGDSNSPLLKSRLHQVYGLGLLIRNENLIINTFQLSFGVYPNPGGPTFKFNPISGYQLRFNDFFLSKPDLITYR
ncbi:MAG TPA: hypothetical protein VD908_17530 [Cytophagales bacterium]|nr:hypothetical protein [Cytophagales bacterium]